MLIVGIISRKGGVGKTTLAAALGVEAASRGRKALLLDLDPQGSLVEWSEAREADSPGVAPATTDTLSRLLDGAKRQGFDIVFIDTPPSIASSAKAAAAISDVIVIPVKASPNDMRTLPKTMEIVRPTGKPYLLTLTQTIAKARLTAESLALLSEVGPVAPAIGNRALYPAAMIDGRSAQEIDPGGPAALEIRALYAQILHHENQKTSKPK